MLDESAAQTQLDSLPLLLLFYLHMAATENIIAVHKVRQRHHSFHKNPVLSV